MSTIAAAARTQRDRYRSHARELVARAKFSPERSAYDREQDLISARSAIRTAWAFHRRYMELRKCPK